MAKRRKFDAGSAVRDISRRVFANMKGESRVDDKRVRGEKHPKREMDKMLAQMQAPGAREAMQRAFDATPEQLGEAAVRQAKNKMGA